MARQSIAPRRHGDSGVLHMVAIPLPLQGHINPLLHMLGRISSPEFITSMLVPEQDYARMQRSVANHPYIRILAIPLEIYNPGDITALPSSQQLMKLLDALEESQEGLVKVIAGEDFEKAEGRWSAPVSCLLVDLFVRMAQDLANRLRVPRIGLWTSGGTAMAVVSSIPALISDGIVPCKGEVAGDLPVTCVPGIQHMVQRDLPHSLLFPPHPDDLSKRIKIFLRCSEAACILVNTVEELEPQPIRAMQDLFSTKILAIGPLLPSAFLRDDPPPPPSSPAVATPRRVTLTAGEGLWKEDVDCLNWLDEQAPSSVLYISFGSMATLSAQQIQQIALALESTKQRFLWVMRPNLVNNSEAGDADFDRAFIARTKSQGLVISWAPQLQVLKHPSVAGFLTHCGWNSTLEAISCGIPMLGWPCFAEQNINCKFIVDYCGIGLRFSTHGFVHHDEVHRIINLLMVDDVGKNIRKRALEMRDQVRRAVKEGGSSSRNLSLFVDLIRA